MNTKRTLDAIPEIYRRQLEAYRTQYQKDKTTYEAYKERSNGYLRALADARIITEAERRIILTYITL